MPRIAEPEAVLLGGDILCREPSPIACSHEHGRRLLECILRDQQVDILGLPKSQVAISQHREGHTFEEQDAYTGVPESSLKAERFDRKPEARASLRCGSLGQAAIEVFR